MCDDVESQIHMLGKWCFAIATQIYFKFTFDSFKRLSKDTLFESKFSFSKRCRILQVVNWFVLFIILKAIL